MSTGIPAPRDDDPEEVSDKLSIAAAMWARGETADAINWLRRAAASAADAEADDRALELAKAAADLTTAPAANAPAGGGRAAMGMTVPTGTKPAPGSQAPPPSRPPTNAPPKPPPSRSAVPAAPPVAAAAPHPPPSTAKAIAAIAGRPDPRPATTPPPAGHGRLGPLPPIRPLGAASAQARPAPPPPRAASASSSSMKAVTAPSSGETTAEGAPPHHAPSSASMRAATRSAMPEGVHPAPAQTPLHESIEHDQTSVMPLAQSQALAKSGDHEAALTPQGGTHESPEDEDLRQTMRRDAEDRTTSTGGEPDAPVTSEAITGAAPTEDPADLPLSIGVRVRIFTSDGGAWVVPEGPDTQGGVAAILVPQEAAVDLRAIFVKK